VTISISFTTNLLPPNQAPQLLIPDIHELGSFLQHWDNPKEVWESLPFHQVCFDTLLPHLLIQEHGLLMGGVFCGRRNIGGR
jgi:hypothetical protein